VEVDSFMAVAMGLAMFRKKEDQNAAGLSRRAKCVIIFVKGLILSKNSAHFWRLMFVLFFSM